MKKTQILLTLISLILTLISASIDPENQQIGAFIQGQPQNTEDGFQDPIRLPLLDIDIKAKIKNNIADVQLSQYYLNTNDYPVEAYFLFPVNPNAVFHQFRVKKGCKIMTGVIKGKAEAKEEYSRNFQRGNTVAYSSLEEDAQDIMRIQLGNILPRQEIRVILDYIEPLHVSYNKFWGFSIPSTLTPRFNSKVNIQDIPKKKLEFKRELYHWNISVDIQAESPISFLECMNGHSCRIQYSQANQSASVTFSNREVPNKDFWIYFRDSNMYEAEVALEQHSVYNESIMGYVSFFPEFNRMNLTDTIKVALASSSAEQSQFLVEKMDEKYRESGQGEFIFVLDRSGSMDSLARNGKLQESTINFLKALPADSYFNILSFGTRFETLFKSSVKTSEETVNFAIQKVSKFSANLGGTEIYPPIKYAFNIQRIADYPRNIFLLTDGDVGDHESIISMVHKQHKKRGDRLFTIGIGNGVSKRLLRDCAKAGGGFVNYLKESDDIPLMTKKVLSKTVSPYLSEFEIEIEPKNSIDFSLSSLSSRAVLLKEERFQLFFKLTSEYARSANKEDIIVNLKYKNSLDGKLKKREIRFKAKKQLQKGDLIHKLGIKNWLDKQEFDLMEIRDSPKSDSSSYRLKVERIVQESVKYQVLCPQTAFILTVQHNQNVHVDNTQKVSIPSIQSDDYSQKEIAMDMSILERTEEELDDFEMQGDDPIGYEEQNKEKSASKLILGLLYVFALAFFVAL